MASTKEYLSFVLEQLSDLDKVSFRPMMGEYILYFRGKVFLAAFEMLKDFRLFVFYVVYHLITPCSTDKYPRSDRLSSGNHRG